MACRVLDDGNLTDTVLLGSDLEYGYGRFKVDAVDAVAPTSRIML